MITFQDSQLCVDGVERSDCVWLEGGFDFKKDLCGKPMVAVVDYGLPVLPRSRTCQEHLDLVIANHPDARVVGA